MRSISIKQIQVGIYSQIVVKVEKNWRFTLTSIVNLLDLLNIFSQLYDGIHLHTTWKINYVNMQHDYITMQFIYVNMQHNCVGMHHNYVDIRDIDTRLKNLHCIPLCWHKKVAYKHNCVACWHNLFWKYATIQLFVVLLKKKIILYLLKTPYASISF